MRHAIHGGRVEERKHQHRQEEKKKRTEKDEDDQRADRKQKPRAKDPKAPLTKSGQGRRGLAVPCVGQTSWHWLESPRAQRELHDGSCRGH